MRTIIGAGLCAIALSAQSAPSVISDPWSAPPYPTHCTLQVNAQPKGADVPVAKDAAGKPYCSFDISSLPTGTNTLKATAVLIDPTWGRLESVPSAPLNIARPGVPDVPAALKISP